MKLFRRILRYCVPMAVYITIKALNRDIDKYMIALLTDTETLAVYSNASKPLPVDIIMHSFYTVLVPEITRMVTAKDDEGATKLYRVFLELAYISNAMICCAALAAAPQMMELFYSNKYMSGLPVFCLYILVDMLQFTNATLILTAAGKTKELMYLGSGSLLVNVVLNGVLFHFLGVIGPAIATLVTTLLLGIVLLTAGARQLGRKLTAFFDMGFFLHFAGENLLAIAVFTYLQRWLAGRGVHYFATLLLTCCGYCGVMMLLHGKRLLRDLKLLNQSTGKNG